MNNFPFNCLFDLQRMVNHCSFSVSPLFSLGRISLLCWRNYSTSPSLLFNDESSLLFNSYSFFCIFTQHLWISSKPIISSSSHNWSVVLDAGVVRREAFAHLLVIQGQKTFAITTDFNWWCSWVCSFLLRFFIIFPFRLCLHFLDFPSIQPYDMFYSDKHNT